MLISSLPRRGRSAFAAKSKPVAHIEIELRKCVQAERLIEAKRARLDRAHQHFQLIADKAGGVLDTLDVIVSAVNPATDALQPLADYVSSVVREFLSTCGIRCRLKSPSDTPTQRVTATPATTVALVEENDTTHQTLYTQEALNFAEGKPLELIDGAQFAEMVKSFQGRALRGDHTPAEATLKDSIPERPKCRTCGAGMILRRSRTGTNAGQEFWGCSIFPRCRGRRQVSARTE